MDGLGNAFRSLISAAWTLNFRGCRGILNLPENTDNPIYPIYPAFVGDVFFGGFSSRKQPPSTFWALSPFGEVEGLGFRPETLSPKSHLATARSFALPERSTIQSDGPFGLDLPRYSLKNIYVSM